MNNEKKENHAEKEMTLREMRHYRGKAVVEIRINCRDSEEMQQAKEAVMYHFELLMPTLEAKGNMLTVRMQPLDPSLFGWQEGLEIIRQTFAQSYTGANTPEFVLVRKENNN